MGVEHDPRIPPVGRLISAHIEELEDGEFAADGVAETFEKAEEIAFKNDGREIPLRYFKDECLHIDYDRSYDNHEDKQILKEIESLISVEIGHQVKKAVEPISLLIIAGSFIAGGIVMGFLSKIGSDAWDLFKDKLIKLMKKKQEENKEYLLAFEFTVQKKNQIICLETVLSNPSESEISEFLQSGLKELDRLTPQLLEIGHGLKKIVFEYREGKLRVIFGLRKDGVPLQVDIDML